MGSLDSCMEAWSWLGDAWVASMYMWWGGGPSGVHGLGGLMEPLEVCRKSVGHNSWSILTFGALLVDDITFEVNMCTLGV
jgi:hypothetical protein